MTTPRGMMGLIYGREGMGKTSLGLRFQGPVHCKSIGETGYEDLEMVGAVPENSVNSNVTSFQQLVEEVSKVTSGTVLLDSTKGLQSLIFDYVCARYYDNDWKRFHSYSSGARQESPQVLQNFLQGCSNKAAMGVNIILLGHVGTIPLPNSMGANYLCHVVNLDDGDKGLGMRSVLTAWCGFILFLNMAIDITRPTEVDTKKMVMEGKAQDLPSRLIYTSLSPGHQAKNRWNMPPIINMGDSPDQAWANLSKHFPAAYKQKALPSK